MFCPKCRTEYRNGFTTCADCEVPLISELLLDLLKTGSEYVKYVHLYSAQNEVELALLKSILDSEGVKYFVRNDNFGSMEVGPRIGLFNAKMIEVQDDHYERTKELLADYLEKTTRKSKDRRKSIHYLIRYGWCLNYWFSGG